MAKEFLTNCFVITASTNSKFIRENSTFDRDVYNSFQDFTDDLYRFCLDYDLRTDVGSVNSSNTEYQIDFYAEDHNNVDIIGSMFVKVEISRKLEDYISVRPF